VFWHSDAKPIKSYAGAWERACYRAARGGREAARKPLAVVVKPQLEGRIVHDFRRTAVRNLVRAGVSEGGAMAMTGHKTRAVFERYNITSETDIRDAGAKLAAYLAPQKRKLSKRS